MLLSQAASAYGKATIPVGEDPKDVAVNPKTNMVYVANFDNVAVIDGSTNTVVSKIPIGDVNGWAIEVNPNSGKVYVAGHLSASILVLDASTNAVVATIHLNGRPTGIAINPETNTIYAASSDVMEIAVIDGATHKVIERIERDGDFRRISMDPSSGLVYAGNVQYGTVDVIRNMSVDSFRKSYDAQIDYPQAIDVNPETGRVYVSDSDSVLVIGSDNDGHALLERVEVGGIPMGIAVNPETNMVYVANFDDDSISVIDGKTNKVILTPWSVWRDRDIFRHRRHGGAHPLQQAQQISKGQKVSF
ncbi:MAG: YncE family protein [Nitrososphaera sp.]|uniref:YncE family protein n=1 Tax=Nitrososphaera sp. TaxID=1971748 RepID=UPI003D6E8582